MVRSFCYFYAHCWKDFTNYKLLILRTYHQFSGHVWLAHNKAFREHAARIVDWSTLNVQLYNFCAVGESVRCGLDNAFNDLHEHCRSWNRGHCSTQSMSCRFAHRCSHRDGPYQSRACSSHTDHASKKDRKPRSSLPYSSSSSSRSKRL